MKPWVKAVTSSTDEEVNRITSALPERVREGIQSDTASTDEEYQALRRRLYRIQLDETRARNGMMWPTLALGTGLALAGAAAAAVIFVPSTPTISHTSPSLAAGERITLSDELVAINDSITVTGLGDLQIDQIHEEGADLSLLDGEARFEVDPEGASRILNVTAGNVAIEVVGTVFRVDRDGNEVEVFVERGKVKVVSQDQTSLIATGEQWTSTRVPPAPAAEPTPQMVVSKPPAEESAVTQPAPKRTAQVEIEDAPALQTAPGAAAVDEEAVVDCNLTPWIAGCKPTIEVPNQLLQSPEARYEAMRAARSRMGSDATTARQLVQDANLFLDQFASSPLAIEVLAMRVEAAYFGSRASTTISFADAYLATAPKSHAAFSDVERWRRVATMRRVAFDEAQRDCKAADAHLADLIRIEQGYRKDQAIAWRGLCYHREGAFNKARGEFQKIGNESKLPSDLQRRIRQAWTDMRDAD